MIEVKRSYRIDEVESIDIRLASGDVQAASGSGDSIQMRARIHSNDETELLIDLAEGRLRLVHRELADGEKAGELFRRHSAIDLSVTLPTAADPLLTVRTGNGDVKLEGVRRVTAVKSGKGDVACAGVLGDLRIDSGAGDVAAADIEGQLEIHTGAGDVAVSGCGGKLAVRTGKGDVAVSGVRGVLEINSGAGDIRVNDWQDQDGAGQNSVNTGSGDLVISRARARRLQVRSGRGDGVLRQATIGQLDLGTGSGDFDLDGDPGAGRWQVKTANGDIALRVPGTAALRIEAATRFGTIESDLPMVRVAKPGPVSQHGGRSIVVVGDEPRGEITLESGRGDIAVRFGGSAPATVGLPVAVVEVAASRALDLPPSQPAPVARTAPDRDVTMQVLESLSRGEISVDEAETLLKALS